ncbi:MAG TPA: Ig-like domain repeat protein, partial [Elusimicrobiales bacterium]|nr:Ig-like domain repeat protein [Elusimicrobiales bacterium]
INPDAGRNYASFTVNPKPDITSLVPAVGDQGVSGLWVQVLGSGFSNIGGSPAVTFANPGITVLQTVYQNSGRVDVQLNVDISAATGAGDVFITNPDGGKHRELNGFSVGPKPLITGIHPGELGRGAENETLYITGNYFQAGLDVDVLYGLVTVGGVNVIDAQHAEATVSVAAGAAAGPWDIKVTNTGGGYSTLASTLTIGAYPVSSITRPALPYYNAAGIAQLAGGASADAADIWTSIQDLTQGSTWYDGANFAAQTEQWLDSDYNVVFQTWTYTTPVAKLLSGRQYKIRSRAYGFNGGRETPGAGAVFTYDNNPPAGSMTTPQSGGVTLKELPELAGSSSDGISGPARVDIQLRRRSDDHYWDGSAFVNNPSTWVAAADVDPWSYTGFSGSLTSGTTYTMRARVYDNAGNTYQTADKTVTFDNTGPVSLLTFPGDDSYLSASSLAEITGTAKDYPGAGGLAAGLYEVETIVERDIPAGWWTGVEWKTVQPSTWPVASMLGGDPMVWDTPMVPAGQLTDNAEYRVHTRARDNAVDITETAGTGNLGAESVHTFYYDNSVPASNFTGLADGDHKSSLAAITGTANDDVSAYAARKVAAVKVHIYDDSSGKTYNGDPDPADWDIGDLTDGAHWFDAVYVGRSSGTWTFTSPAWQHSIRYRVVSRAVDGAGNYQVPLSTAYFVYDEYRADPESPDSGVTFPPDGQHFNYKFASITGTSVDNTRGVLTGVRLKVLRLPSGALGESTTYYWDNVLTDWSSSEPPLSNWPLAAADDAVFDSNYEDWHWDPPQSGLAGLNFWKAGRSFLVAPRSFDKAGNNEVLFSTTAFVYEVGAPTAAVTYPVSGFYITQQGRVTGTAADIPPGEVEKVEVRIKRRSDDHYWRVSDSSWTLEDAPQVWNDVTLYGTLSPGGTWWQLNGSPWDTDILYDMDARVVDRAGNWGLSYSSATGVTADFTLPASTVAYPAHLSELAVDVPVISGTASDNSPGELDKVLVSYYKEAAPAGWWNRATGAWDSAEELFYEASLGPGDAWTATGASSPTWIAVQEGIYYRIFAKAVDKAGNEVVKPGSPAPGPYIRFKLLVPGPVSTIDWPDASLPHLNPSPPPVLSGTALNATTVQLRITDYGADLTEGTGNDDLVWNGSAWVSTSAFSGYVGVVTFDGENWQWSIPSDSWGAGVSGNFRVVSKATHTVNGEEYPGPGREFVMDGLAPVTAVTLPAKTAHRAGELPELRGTAWDAVPGARVSQNFQIRLASTTGAGDNWNGSVFYSSAAVLPATLAGSFFQYSDGQFAAGTIFKDGWEYEVRLLAGDKAGNQNSGSGSAATFRYDLSSPTASVDYPAASGNYQNVAEFYGPKSDPDPDPASDKIEASGVEKVYVAVSNALNNFWGGAAFDSYSAGGSWLECEVHQDSWTFTDAALTAYFAALANPQEFKLYVRAVDYAGNSNRSLSNPTGVSPRYFTVDHDLPVSVSTFPVHDSFAFAVSTPLAGTALDTSLGSPESKASGIDPAGVRLMLRRTGSAGDGYDYYNGVGGWGGTMGFNLPIDVSGSGITEDAAWTSQGDSVYGTLFTEGYRYEMIPRARDLAGNYQTVFTTSAFGVDKTPPAVVGAGGRYAGVPEHGGFYQTLSMFTGAAGDYSPFAAPRNYEAGLGTTTASQSVQVAFRRLSDGKWWDGADFTLTQDEPEFGYGAMPFAGTYNDGTSLMGVSSGTWEYYIDPAKLTNDTTYYVVARVKDLAGNLQTAHATNYFTVDVTTPASAVTAPAEVQGCADSYKFTSMTSLAGTAEDYGLGELSVVRLRIIREKTDVPNDDCSGGTADDRCWDGSAWVGPAGSCDIWIDSGTLAGGDWTYALPPGFLSPKSVYRLSARARDKAGNIAGTDLPARVDYDRRFRFAENVPVTYITAPGVNQRFKPETLANIEGTSQYSQSVAVRITRNSDGQDWKQYVSSGEYVAAPYWNVPVSTSGGAGNWMFSVSTTAWAVANSSYSIRSYGESPGGQCEGDEYCISPLTRGNAAFNVYSDTQPPYGLVSLPAAGNYNSLAEVRGTARDMNTLGGLSVNALRLRIRNAGTAECYNSGTWGSCGAASDISLAVPSGGNADGSCDGSSCGTVDWSTASAAGWGLQTGYQYEFLLRPADLAGNLSVYPDIPALTIVFDTTPPLAVTTRPVAGYVYKDLTILSGTAADPAPGAAPRNNAAGLNYNDFQLVAYDQDNKQWGGSTFDYFASSWVALPVSASWDYPGSVLNSKLSTGRYLIKSRALDQAGNQQSVFEVGRSSFVFYVDKSSPTAYIVKPAHDQRYLSTQLAGLDALNGTALDPQESYYGG